MNSTVVNSNVVFLRDRARLRRDLRADSIKSTKSNRQPDLRNCGQPQERVRPVLTAAWHTNPASGHLECHWTTDVAGNTDESASRDDLASNHVAPLQSILRSFPARAVPPAA